MSQQGLLHIYSEIEAQQLNICSKGEESNNKKNCKSISRMQTARSCRIYAWDKNQYETCHKLIRLKNPYEQTSTVRSSLRRLSDGFMIVWDK
jgi:hypothetical protein